MFGKKTARVLDDAAHVAMATGRRLGGETGETAAARLVDATLGGLRDRCATPCTRCERGICEVDA